MSGSILDKIIDAKRIRVADAKKRIPQDRLVELAAEIHRDKNGERFREALSDPKKVNIIGEFKRASPSRGNISDRFAPAEVARMYETAGAAAISVLTEEDYFAGSLEDLHEVRKNTSLPVLRKDFIVDEYQLFESAAVGADAILLIVSVLTLEELEYFLKLAGKLGMAPLAEVHDLDELRIALDAGADLIGVNNRNLKTFNVSLEVSELLIKSVPAGKLVVSESGISTNRDINRLRNCGYSAFLIGETLMRADDPAAGLRKLIEY